MNFETLRSKLKSQTSSPLCTKEESDKCGEAQTAQKSIVSLFTEKLKCGIASFNESTKEV